MRQKLQNLEFRIDSMLQPPMPRTEEQRAMLIPKNGANIQFPGPVLEKWTPPVWVPRCGDGFWLAQNVVCYQRGYYPQKLYRNYIEVAAESFHSQVDSEMQVMSRMAFDYFVAVVDSDEVASGCTVEFRPDVTNDKTPYLYISTLCTNSKYRHKGLAHQLVHSIYTLGMLMLEQNDRAPGIWRGAIPNKHLNVGLMVRIESGYEKLIKLYSHCGFSDKQLTPLITYKSFTPYTVYNWQLESDDTMIPMYKAVSTNVLYEDKQIRIYMPSSFKEKFSYHSFPSSEIQNVRDHGIINSKQACLLNQANNKLYTTDPTEFSTTKPSAQGVFRIAAEQTSQIACLSISVPAWFAAEIYCVNETIS